MRKLFKKSMALVLTSAMAITGAVSVAPQSQKTAKAADSVATYNAYTVFQTDKIFAYRNQWTDGTSGGLDGGKGKGVDYQLKNDAKEKITFNYLKNWVLNGYSEQKEDGTDGKELWKFQAVDGQIKDAKIDHEGDYEISIGNMPLADKVEQAAKNRKEVDKDKYEDEKWSMLVISTDIPFDNKTVKCTNIKVYLDDETKPFAELAEAPRNTEKKTSYGASNFEIFSSYAEEHGTKGKVLDNTKAEYKRFPKKSMRITFHISGVDFSVPKKEIPVVNGIAENATFTSGNFKYKVTERSMSDGTKGKAVIAGLAPAAASKASLSTVAVAENTDKCKYDVTGIAAKAFQNSKKLKKIKVGSTIASIGSNAFKGCKKLTSITYNKKVKSVAASTFEGCTSLSKITLGSKVKSIGKSAFKGCKKLSKISVSQKVKVSKGAFKGCKKTIKVSGKKANKKYTVAQIKKSGYKKVK